MCDQQRLRSACAYAQSDQSLSKWLEYSISVKLLIEHHLEFLSLKEDCTRSPESRLVKMPHCWESQVTAHMFRDRFLCLIDRRHYQGKHSAVLTIRSMQCQQYSCLQSLKQTTYLCRKESAYLRF